jgi:nitrate reductase NapD
MNNEIHIASLVVHYDPERTAEISKIISSLPGTELHDVEAPGKFVVLLEADSEKLISDNINTISVSAGVYSASLVYHHHEPAAALAEEIIT